MNAQSSIIECPECGCREIHREYENYFEHGLITMSRVIYHADESISAEPVWCYCMGCGVMFDPVREGFAV
jgi:hypothetical protein